MRLINLSVDEEEQRILDSWWWDFVLWLAAFSPIEEFENHVRNAQAFREQVKDVVSDKSSEFKNDASSLSLKGIFPNFLIIRQYKYRLKLLFSLAIEQKLAVSVDTNSSGLILGIQVLVTFSESIADFIERYLS